MKDATLTSFCNYKAKPPRSLSDEEFEAFQNLSKNTNLGIQNSDKGNLVVILKKDVYILDIDVYKHIESLLSDNAKFEKVDPKKGLLNFTVNHEKQINKF